MASHPSVTRCDVSAPYRHTVTSRHTPFRGVTDVTCDAGVRDHRFHRRPYRPAARRTEPYQWGTSNDFRPPPHIDIDFHYARYHLRVGKAEITRGVSRERYVCLTGENLAGWNYYHATKSCFFCPPPSERVLRHKDFSHGAERH